MKLAQLCAFLTTKMILRHHLAITTNFHSELSSQRSVVTYQVQVTAFFVLLTHYPMDLLIWLENLKFYKKSWSKKMVVD